LEEFPVAENVDLELLRKDYTRFLREACQLFVGAASRLEKSVDDPWMPGLRAEWDRCLVQMIVAENRATRLILPSPDAMEYFGLPRSATSHAFAPDPTIRIQDPHRETWDFRPWLSEKLTHLREHLQGLLEALETDLDETDAGAPGSPNTSELGERLREQAAYSLRASRGYALEILGAIDNLGLTVIDWRLGSLP
jgi:hypothetical protein